MRIVLLGAPGAGKGTQSKFITRKYGIQQISTGDLLRNEIKLRSKIGKQAERLMNSGLLVADELVVELVKKRIRLDDCSNGFLLDGFPRNQFQADCMKKLGININYLLELVIPDKVIIERITGRRIHVNSGRIYHVKFNPPKKENTDDITGEVLEIRDDDREDTVRKRIKEYHQQTASLIRYYCKEIDSGSLRYFRINGNQKINAVSTDLYYILG